MHSDFHNFVLELMFRPIHAIISGARKSEIPCHMSLDFYFILLLLWSIYKSIRQCSLHGWDADSIKWGKCLCFDESAWSTYNASQFLPTFLCCTGLALLLSPTTEKVNQKGKKMKKNHSCFKYLAGTLSVWFMLYLQDCHSSSRCNGDFGCLILNFLFMLAEG